MTLTWIDRLVIRVVGWATPLAGLAMLSNIGLIGA